MTGEASFAVLLTRLSAHRELAPDALSQLADVPEAELHAVFEGGAPSPSLLRRLAPALGLHAADLFAIADVPTPDDLAPLDPDAGRSVRDLVGHVMSLPPEKRSELRQLVTTLPREKRTKPAILRHRPTYTGPGGILMRMLAMRNLGLMDVAVMFLEVSGRYWSASTYGMVGAGRKQLTPDLLFDYSALLDVSADDLAALTGMTPVSGPPARKPSVADVAELIWAARRLTANQVEHVHSVAKTMGPPRATRGWRGPSHEDPRDGH